MWLKTYTGWPLVWKTWKCQGIDLSGKSCLKLFIVSKAAYLCPYMYLVGVYSVLNIKYMVLDHALLHSYSTTDNNTSTGTIWVTLNMPSALEECRKPSGNFTLSGEWSPCTQFVYCTMRLKTHCLVCLLHRATKNTLSVCCHRSKVIEMSGVKLWWEWEVKVGCVCQLPTVGDILRQWLEPDSRPAGNGSSASFGTDEAGDRL